MAKEVEAIYLTLMREQILEVRWKADTREQPGSLHRRQRIIGYSEYHTGSLGGERGHWRAIVVLACGARIELDEQSRY